MSVTLFAEGIPPRQFESCKLAMDFCVQHSCTGWLDLPLKGMSVGYVNTVMVLQLQSGRVVSAMQMRPGS